MSAWPSANSILLTIARRLGRLLKPQDTLPASPAISSRMILLFGTEPGAHHGIRRHDPPQLACANRVRRRQIFLTASIGLVLYEGIRNARGIAEGCGTRDVPCEAHGADRIEVFKPTMRRRKSIASRWNRTFAAQSSGTKSRSFISRSCGWKIAPLPASRRWPAGIIRKLGRLVAERIHRIAEEIGLISDLGRFVLERAAGSSRLGSGGLAPRPLRQRQLSPRGNCCARTSFNDLEACCPFGGRARQPRWDRQNPW